MRVLASICLCVATLGLGSAAARGASFTGSFVVQVGDFPPVALPGSGSGDPTLPLIDPDAFVGTSAAFFAPVPPISQVFFSVASHAGGPVGSGPTFAGTVQLRGSGIGFVLLQVPLAGLGFPGATAMLHSLASATNDVVFGGWTTGVATVARSHTGMTDACTPGGTVCPSAALGGATANAAYFGGAAQIVLVAPIDVWSSLAEGVPSFGVLALNYVPEPAAFLLLASAGLALAVAGRRRRS